MVGFSNLGKNRTLKSCDVTFVVQVGNEGVVYERSELNFLASDCRGIESRPIVFYFFPLLL